MLPRTQILDLLESAFRLDVDDEPWLSELAEGVKRLHALPGRALAYMAEAQGENLTIRRGYTEGFSAVAATHGIRGVMAHTPAAHRRLLFAEGVCATTSSDIARRQPLSPSGLETAEAAPSDVMDSVHMGGRDAGGNALYVGTLSDVPVELQARTRKRLLEVGPHLVAAGRLRARLGGLDALEAAHAGRHLAVFDPEGRLRDAPMGADGQAARRIARAVQLVELTRIAGRRADTGEVLALYRALVTGGLSIVHQVDRDGKRYYVAIENAPETRPLRRLDPAERATVAYAATGVSHKVAALTLGLDESSVSRALKRALAKMGLPTRGRWVELVAHLGLIPALEAPAAMTHVA